MKIKNKSLQTWAKLLPFLAPYKWQMILIIALMILGACFDMVQPLFSGYAVDNFIEPRTTEGLIPFTAVYLSMVVVQTITTILMAIYALKVEMYLGRDLKRKLFDHLQTLDFSYYNTTPVGTIMARLMSDTGKIGTVLAWSLVDIFWSSMYVLGCVVIMLFVNWKLALILIAIIPIIAVITVVFQKKILAVNRRVRAINAEVTRHYNEGISGAKTSKTLVIEEKNDKAFEKVAEDMRSTTIRAVRLNAVYIPIISFLTAIGVAMVLNQGGNMVLFGDITVGEMTVFINYALIIADPVQQLARTISNFISTQVNIERVSALLERESLIKDTPEVIERYGTVFDPKRENWEPIQGHITFDDVTFRYPDGEYDVLRDISFTIAPGESVGIVGKTGAGKTALVDLLLRTYNVPDGTLFVDGRDVNSLSIHSVRNACAYVPQDNFLFSDTIAHNIAFGVDDATPEDIERAASMADVRDNIVDFKDGYETVLGERGVTVSGGQKQRISIARALLKDAPILILDDSVSAVDTSTEKIILDNLKNSRAGKTTLLIAHRISTVERLDKIIFLNEGRVEAVGPHDQLYASCPEYRRMVDLQRLEDETKGGENA